MTAWEFMFLKHPDRKQPLASGFLKHRAENEWFEGELSRLINREDPALPIGILMVMNDFSESFPYQFKDKISQQIYDKQPVMLAPTPCLFTYRDQFPVRRLETFQRASLANTTPSNRVQLAVDS